MEKFLNILGLQKINNTLSYNNLDFSELLPIIQKHDLTNIPDVTPLDNSFTQTIQQYRHIVSSSVINDLSRELYKTHIIAMLLKLKTIQQTKPQFTNLILELNTHLTKKLELLNNQTGGDYYKKYMKYKKKYLQDKI